MDKEKTSPENGKDLSETLGKEDRENSVPISSENVNNHIESDENDENENDCQSDSNDSGGTSSGDDSDSDNDSDSDSDSDKPDDGISAYERLRIERIRRNEERLKQLGLVDPSKKLAAPKRRKRTSIGGAARSKERHVPKRSQPTRSAKKTAMEGGLLSGSQIDLRRSWPLRQSYKGHFGSQKNKGIVEKYRYSKRYHCGECRACKREDDCHTCVYCAFNSRQGRASSCRRRCLFKMCLRRLVDVEVDIEAEAEEKRNTREGAPANENTTKTSFESDETVKIDDAMDTARDDGNRGNLDRDYTTVAESKDINDVTKVEGDDQAGQQTPQQPKCDENVEQSTNDSDCAEEKSQSAKKEEVVNIKVPIENSEYFASYRMEENESGVPKWMDEFYKFMATIPHGPLNRVSGQKNADSTMSQVCKLVTGEGVTYHLWPEGTYFKKGIKVHLGMDLSALHREAVAMERRYEDRRKGSLLRHPIAKMICFKEWIANGKPEAPETPISPLLALPPPTTEKNHVKNDDESKTTLKKRVVAMTIEQQIKPNRISWASSSAQAADNVVFKASEVASNTAALTVQNEAENLSSSTSVEEGCNVNEMKTSGCPQKDTTPSEDAATNNKDNHVKYAEVANDFVVKLENDASQGDDKENKKEFIRNDQERTKNHNIHDKGAENSVVDEAIGENTNASKDEAIPSATNETTGRDQVVAKASSSNFVDGDSQLVGSNATKTMPTACSVCSMGGDLICCDGCSRGFHSNCHFPKIKEIPVGEWFCKDCTRKNRPQSSWKKTSRPRREVFVNNKLFQGEHDDECYMCYLGGDLICCDFCEKAYHLECHIPPLHFVPEGIWKCCECKAVERRKKTRCGECEACTREECGQCKFCLDKPKFGGSYTLRQVCIKKVCPYLRFAPAASSIVTANTNVPGMFPWTVRKRGRPRKLESNGMPIVDSDSKSGRPRKSVDSDTVGIVETKRKRGRPRKVDNDIVTILEPKRKRGRPRKSVSDDCSAVHTSSITTITKRKRGRPRKTENGVKLKGDNISTGTITKRKPGRPRKSVDGDSSGIGSCSPASPAKKQHGRPRKSVDADTVVVKTSSIVSTPKKKRGRPRKSVDIEEMKATKRVIVESDDEKLIIQPVIFRYKISSLKSAYDDPESVKIRKIIKSAVRDPSDSKTVDKACERLRKCMKSAENVKTAMLFGGVEMLCNAMKDHPDKNILQAEACCTLAEMLWVFPGISKKLAYMNTIDLIVSSIHRCSNNSKVQQMGCGALGAFSYDESFTKQIIDAGGLRAVEVAMERFPKKLAVLMEGCYFFQNMIARSVDALQLVSNSKVVPIIVEMMTSENLERGYLIPMFGLIANLAVNEEGKELIGQSDAISATISALCGDYDVEVKQAACTVLKNLAVGSCDNQTKIAENGGLDAIFTAFRSHPNDELLLILSFNVMRELCVNDEEIANDIVSNGGIKIILKAMHNYDDLATMQIAGCEVIGYLILKGKSEIHAPKLVKAVVTAMKNHSEDSDVQIQACDALFELSQISTTRLILKKKETKELLLQAKSRFKDCESDVDDIIAASSK